MARLIGHFESPGWTGVFVGTPLSESSLREVKDFPFSGLHSAKPAGSFVLSNESNPLSDHRRSPHRSNP